MAKSLLKSDGYATLVKRVSQELSDIETFIKRRTVEGWWRVGKYINDHLLANQARAGYGATLYERLGEDVDRDPSTLQRAVLFYRTYPIPARAQELSFDHYRRLMTVKDDAERKRLEEKIIRNNWTRDELQAYLNSQRRQDKGDSPQKGTVPTSPTPANTTPLVAKRGTLYTYRLIERPNVAASSEPGLLLDLGFCVFRNVEPKLISQFKAGDIVSSYPKDDAYKFSCDGRTAKDLFTYTALVEKVTDGDTLKVRLDLGFDTWIKQTLRLRGIDAPEIDTPEGQRAKAFVQSHIKEADRITIWSSKSEKYDRYLADVYYGAEGQETFLNQQLLDEGLAKNAD